MGLCVSLLCSAVAAAEMPSQCEGKIVEKWNNLPKVLQMQEGLAAYGKANVNVDGYGRAYHRKNYATDAVIHLCNAGKVYLPDGSSYQGSESNQTCTGKFMDDLAKIEAAGWTDPKVGVINWFGVLGKGQAKIGGETIKNIKPVVQNDGSGYYVSPAALFDPSIPDETVQERYVHPLKVPAAVIPKSLVETGIKVGSFGVALSPDARIAVPFVVGDTGPKVGEGTPALLRLLSGRQPSDTINRNNRYVGQVEERTVLWVFFGGDASKYDHAHPEATVAASREAFGRWGGMPRLQACRARLQ
jgi:hypothetical protein